MFFIVKQRFVRQNYFSLYEKSRPPLLALTLFNSTFLTKVKLAKKAINLINANLAKYI